MRFSPAAKLLAACLFFLSLSGVEAQSTGTSDKTQTRIFALNLWNTAVDLKFGNDGLFSTSGLSPASASQMVFLDQAAPRSVLYRASNADSWQESKKADGTALSYNIKAGGTYMILVQENGVPGLYELKAEANDKAKIAVFNASGKDLATLRIGAAFDSGVEIQGDGLSIGWTDFGDLVPGAYGVFWSYAAMPDGVSFFYVPAKDGKTVGKTSFSAGSWYLLVIRREADKKTDTAVIWDISPASH